MSRKWGTVNPHNPEWLITDVFHTMFLAERGIKGGLRTNFPFPFTFDHNPGTPADEEQNLLRFLMHVVWDHATDLGDIHAHRNILDPAKLGRQ